MNTGSKPRAERAIQVRRSVAWAIAAAARALADYPASSEAARLKDIATVKGVRENILIGYGIVVGLKGTGDSSADITSQSLTRFLGKLGFDLQANAAVKSKK